MRHVDTIIIHCAATPGDVSAATIDQWHRDKGWAGIGYHHVIRFSGAVEPGRPESQIGAHAKGHNKTSIGICLAGGHQGRFNYTAKQLAALHSLVLEIQSRHPITSIIGHNNVTDQKSCPNFDVKAWASRL